MSLKCFFELFGFFSIPVKKASNTVCNKSNLELLHDIWPLYTALERKKD